MKLFLTVALVLLVACSGSPTAPSPPSPVSVPPSPPVVNTPPPVTIPPAFPPNDSRFDLTFYRQFVHNALESLDVLKRQTEAPRIYLRTVHTNGTAIDQRSLDQTALALEQVAGKLTGVFGLAGIERGTGTRIGQPGWITVNWGDDPNRRLCGFAVYGGDRIDLYTNTPNCRCVGGPPVSVRIIKHELGHALGFRHTDAREDLMFPTPSTCDQEPTAREVYHAALAYTRPVGSAAP